MRKLILAVAVLFATATVLPTPSHAMASRGNGARAAGCVAAVLVLGLLGLPLCAVAAKAGSKGKGGKAQVTIHKPESGKCANGNAYRIMRVSNPRSVCKNSICGGKSAPACVNLSTVRGKTHGMIIVPKSGAHLAHEIEHVCRGPEWNHF